MSDLEIAWLAGLLEGEGSFNLTGYRTGAAKTSPVIQLAMTDYDVVSRAATLMARFGGNGDICNQTRQEKTTKQCYRFRISGAAAVDLMRAIAPHMGIRRQIRILELIQIWERR